MGSSMTAFTRRKFLHIVGAVGGSSAVYQAAIGLGLVPRVAHAHRPDIAPVAKDQPRFVAILGGGISGLTAAYELNRRGYRVLILEASHRVGGRNLTLRGGDIVDETGHPQVCGFDADPHLYFNAGPARIPGHHSALLGYCKEFGIELSPFINDNRNAWVQDDAMFGGRPIRNREYVADTRGFMAELLAKSLQPEQLAAPFTKADYQHLLEYARQFGELDERFTYIGSGRAGFARHDYTMANELKQPLSAQELLRSGFMYLMNFTEADDQSAMMMEPVGGMDRIVAGFMQHVGKFVELHAQVESIRLRDQGVDIVYRQHGARHQVRADYCLNCIPMQLLAGIEHNFPNEYADGFTRIPRGKLFKIGLQMKERFWEQQGIYGGISWTMQDIMQIWYPAHGIHRPKGVVLGAYTFDDAAGERFARLSHAERLEVAIKQGERIHPDYRKHVEHGVSVPWHRMNHMLGCSASWTEELFTQWFKVLQAPAGRHYLMGDQMSYHPGWQEGAIHSAFHAITDIDRRVRGVMREGVAA
jgi:monoamine oxidase